MYLIFFFNTEEVMKLASLKGKAEEEKDGKYMGERDTSLSVYF